MPSQLPGSQWLTWLRDHTLRVGVLTGLYLVVVFTAWLLIANRLPWSANFAGLRNGVFGVLLVALMLIPVGRFLRRPARLFFAGVVAWGMLTLAYLILGLFFERLYSRMGPFHVFMLGAVLYGVIAVAAWVASLLLAARHQPVATPRRRQP